MTEKIVAYSAAQVNGTSDLGGESVSEPFVATQVTEAGTVGGVSVSGLFTAVQAEDGYNFVAMTLRDLVEQMNQKCGKLGSIDKFGSSIYKIIVDNGQLKKRKSTVECCGIRTARAKI